MRKWLIKRRMVQLLIIAALFLQHYREDFIIGNLSSMTIMGLELSDPFAALQSIMGSGQIFVPLIISSLIILLFYIIVGGRAFCSWVCPLHLIFEYTDKIKTRMSMGDKEFRISTKYWILALVAALTLLTGIPVFEILSPVGIATRAILFGTWMGLFLLLSIAIFEVGFSKRAWCRYFCPLGAFYSLIGWLSLTRVKIKHSLCTKCMLCKEECLVPHVLDRPVMEGKKIVASGDCTNCGSCIDVCTQGALKLGLRFIVRQDGMIRTRDA